VFPEVSDAGGVDEQAPSMTIANTANNRYGDEIDGELLRFILFRLPLLAA